MGQLFDKMGQELESKTSAVRKNPLLSLKSTLAQLYEQRHETGDIKFVIDSEEIPAHRCILAALSPKYKAQFYGPMSQKDVINVDGVSAAAFKEFLQFFYLDEVTLTLENIEDVLNLAKQSLVDELVTECIYFLMYVIRDKIVWCYQLALDYQIRPLEVHCVQFINWWMCGENPFKYSDFRSCNQEMLCHILNLDLQDCNEGDIFDACILWAQTKCEQDGLDAASTANLRTVLSDAFFKIRFCSMTAEQFANIDKKYSGLLSAQESAEVYRTIALRASGEVSSIFGVNNSQIRGIKQSPLECSLTESSHLKCEYRTEKRRSYYFLSGEDIDSTCCGSIHFSCDKPINLIGFVVCNRIDDIVIEVEIFNVKQIVFMVDQSPNSNNETIVKFRSPIQIKANEPFIIRALYARPLTEKFCADFYALKLKNSVLQNEVSFKIDDESSAITRLLFTICDNSLESPK